MEQQDVDYDALAKEHGGTASTVVDYDALAAQHGGKAAKPAKPTAPASVDYDALAKEHGGAPSQITDPETKAAVARLQAHPIEGATISASPSTWESLKTAVAHPINYLKDVEADTQEGGGRTIVGRTLGHMQARGDQGYEATASSTPMQKSIMAGPVQGPAKVARGALRIMAPPDTSKPIGDQLKEEVGGINELVSGAMQTPGPAIAVIDPSFLPKVVAGGIAQHYAQKGLTALGVPDEYSELGGNIAGVLGAHTLEDPTFTTRGAAKAADATGGKLTRYGLKKILPDAAAPLIEEHVHVPGRTVGLESSEKALGSLNAEVDVARSRLNIAERNLNKSQSAGLTPSEEAANAYNKAKSDFTNAVERQAVAEENIPLEKNITNRINIAKGSPSLASRETNPNIVEAPSPSEYAERWRTPEKKAEYYGQSVLFGPEKPNVPYTVMSPATFEDGSPLISEGSNKLAPFERSTTKGGKGISRIMSEAQLQNEVDQANYALAEDSSKESTAPQGRAESGTSPPAEALISTPETEQPAHTAKPRLKPIDLSRTEADDNGPYGNVDLIREKLGASQTGPYENVDLIREKLGASEKSPYRNVDLIREKLGKTSAAEGIGRIESAIPDAGNIISSVEDEAKKFGAKLPDESAPKPGLKPIDLSRLEPLLNEATGGKPLEPNVPLREQGLGKVSGEEPQKLSSDPRKAVLQKANATPEEITTILQRGSRFDPTSKVGLSRLAEHFGVDLGDSAIGRGKADLAAGTHLPPHEVLKRILDAGHTPAEIVKAINEGKHLPGPVSGGSQGTEHAPTFYSKAERVANDKVSTGGSGDSVLATLRNNGVKESEIQWMGLDDYLKGKPRVSKADVQQFIANNKIELKEVNLGGESHEQLKQLQNARNGAYVENNRIWADHLRRAPHSTELFNAMQDGDPESVIAQLPKNLQEPARNFVVTDNLLRNYDKAIDKMSKRGADKVPHYSAYTLPGEKSNYTEKLLTLPENGNLAELRQELFKADEERKGYLEASRPVPGDVELRFQDAQKAVRQAENISKPFKTAHYPEQPNVLSHVRYDDRVDVDGKKNLFIEEAQSDMHSKRRIETIGSVPNSPFKDTWHELVFKRMLRHAAENNYDKLSWTTGQQQADRYDLGKQVSELEWHPVNGSDNGTLIALDHSGNVAAREQIHSSKLPDYVGKDAAQQLQEAPLQHSESGRRQWRSVKGVDLKMGGDWAKALYDRALPRFLNSYLKKWGSKVEETTLKATDRSDKAGVPYTPPQKVWSVEINDKMKKSLLHEGQPIAKVERPRAGFGRIELAS